MQTGSDLGYGATRENLRCNSDPNILTRKSPCEPNPGARPYPAGRPMKPGRAGRWLRTHDYKRHGTTTLFAALNILDGTRHWPQHAASSPPGVHPLPQRDRGAGPRGESDPCHRRQLCDPQAPKGAPMAGAASPLDGPTSPRPQHPGSTRSKASSPSSPASVQARRVPICRLICNSPSTASSLTQTPTPNHSYGPPTQNAYSPLLNGGSKR